MGRDVGIGFAAGATLSALLGVASFVGDVLFVPSLALLIPGAVAILVLAIRRGAPSATADEAATAAMRSRAPGVVLGLLLGGLSTACLAGGATAVMFSGLR